MSDTQKVLIIYEMVPESTDIFLLDVSKENAKKVFACAGKYINSDDLWPEAEWLSEYLKDKPKQSNKKPFKVPENTTVVHTGFIL